MVEKPLINDRIAINANEVPAHNANSHEYLAIHYLGVNGDNPDLYGGGYGGHFYVSRTGVCYQAAKVTDKLWHVGASSGFSYKHPDARNSNTIGIECGCFSAGGKWYFTESTQDACAKLAAWIMQTYGIPMSNLLRHGDITTKHCPAPYIDNPGENSNWTWEQFKAKVSEYLNGEQEGAVIDVGGEGMVKIPKTLKKGDTGQGVWILEHFLKARGFYTGKLDYEFGDGLDKAVRNFQTLRFKQSGAKLGNSDGTPDGIAGVKTWRDLFGGF